jgi:TRAP-type C4-dicarboxylate transport system substrate-binding protein
VVRLHHNRKARVGTVAISLVSVLALASCAEEAGGGGEAASGSEAEGVEPGASMEDYQAAFADVDPITLNTQSPSPQGSVTGANVEAYLEAITEWSDGKITFEVAYSNGIAPPTEVDDALRDGRLDLGQVLPIYEPAEYPANAALIDAGFISNQSAVVGTLQSNAWPNEVAFNTPEVEQEFADHDMKVLVPIYNSGVNAFFCSEEKTSASAINGSQVAVGGTAQGKQIESLGGASASVPYTELFESLERGVVDCSVSSLTVGVLGGFIPAAPHVVIDPDAGFALAPGAMAMSQTTWDSLPLVAQQLFWDKIDVFMDVNVDAKIWPNTADAVSQAHEGGGSVKTFDDETRETLQGTNEELLEALRGTSALDGDALVDGAQEAADKWQGIVEELGYEDEVDYDGFDEWYNPDELKADEWAQRLMEDVFNEHRPS